uniref:Protein AATF-like n=1 Tax=Ceratitis capitata TaxID=7213 RepID=W8B8F2_CERCA
MVILFVVLFKFNKIISEEKSRVLKMLRKKNSKAKTVSDKITELLTRNANSENESSDDQTEDPRVEEEFDEYDLPDARTSDIRKRNVKLLSEQSARYRGKISSRLELEAEEDTNNSEDNDVDDEQEEEDYSSEDDDSALKAFAKKMNGSNRKVESAASHVDEDEDDSEDGLDKITNFEDNDSELEEGNSEEEDEEDDDEDGIESEDDDDVSEEDNADGTEIIAEKNRQVEIQKGQCVQNQLQIWERLLEARISTQKIISKSNQLPAPETLKAQQQENEKLEKVSGESVKNVSKLLSSLLQLQSALSQQFSEQRNALKKSLKRAVPKLDTENDSPVPIKRFAEHIDAHFQEFKPYRNVVLLKWDDRTKLLTPGAGAKKKSLTEDYDIIRKIENTLQNRTTLIEKSQTIKDGDDDNVENVLDDNGEVVHKLKRNVELYDDSDFYHQQLRELIEYKTNTSVSASEVTQQYMELQKLRQKMKKKVDTRASKGRKLRYTVHNKLINFMAPDDTSTWTEESKDELYRSLFAA